MRNEVLKLFENITVDLGIEQIIKKFKGTKLDESALIKTMQTLELDGLIYYDEKTQRYSTFPSNFYYGKIKKIDLDNQKIVVSTNEDDYTLEMPKENIHLNQHIIFKKSKKKYIYVKALKKDKPCYTYKEELLNIFYPLKNGLSLSEIATFTGTSEKNISEIIDALEQENKIAYDDITNRYYQVKIGKIIPDKKGKLHFEVDNKVFSIPDKYNQDCLKFDTAIFKSAYDNFEFLRVIKRGIPEIVCEITENHSLKVLGNPYLKVKLANKINLPEGTRILVKIGTKQNNHVYEVEYLETLGHKNDFNASLEAIAYTNGFRTNYTEAEMEQINNMPTEVSELDLIGKTDLTHECIFTIDGANTKDIDDAVGIKKLDNGNFELTVSIAAVNSYIKFDSPLWNRAAQNTTSLYLIESVAHMLHPKISNGICSLNPNVLRLAKTFKMEIDNAGKLVKFDILNSVIKSRKKMTYDAVNEILENNIVPEGYEEFVSDLELMHELSDILDNRFNKDGALNFSSKEIKFELDEESQVTNITTTSSKTAENLIKNFMVLTNESVADYLMNLGITGIYRNHEIPINEKLLETTDLIKSLGYQINKIKNSNNPKLIQDVINTLSTKEEFFILSTLLIKSMQKAYYSSYNQGHYALALNAYTQSTSPIRRYLDLVIQYILNNIEMFFDESFDLESFKKYVNEACNRANMMEKCAKKAEYEANKLYMLKYCTSHKDEVFTGFIQDIEPNKIIIRTTNLIEGAIKIEEFNDGNYIYNYKEKKLIHEYTKEQVKIGTKVSLTYSDVNEEFLIVFFKGSTIKDELTLKRI